MSLNAVVPFVDAHCHTHGLSLDAWETIGMTGCAAVVLSCGNPHVYREFHDEAPDWADLSSYWDVPIRFAPEAEKAHLLKVFVAVGISSMTRWEELDRAVQMLPQYLQKPHVVALGEVGIDPWQYWGLHWPLEDQKAVLEQQVRAAKELDLPVILHTPTQRKGFLPEIAADDFKRHFLDMDMEVINRVGLSHQRLMIDHADDSILDYIMNETDAYAGIGIGVRLRHTNPYYFAEVVERLGPDRLIVNTDHLSSDNCDLFAIPRAIREMFRRGIDEKAVRQVVYDNANECLQLGLES